MTECPSKDSDDALLEFRASVTDTIGMELELQLLDADSLDLVDRVIPLLELLGDDPNIKPEYIQNTVEINSDISTDLFQLDSSLNRELKLLKEKCRELNVVLCGAGTHPFSRHLATITPNPRYLYMEKTEGFVSHIQITFATHVHIGMASGEQAITTMRELKPYLPLLLALSASSPFWRSYDTEYASYRHRILTATRSYGIPPLFNDWEDFARFLSKAQRADIFRTVNDIHWDIRPRPHLGTLEVRIMDAQPSISRTVALGGFVRALVEYLRETPAREHANGLPQELHTWFEKENHYQASRLGLEAVFVSDNDGNTRSLRSVLRTVIDSIKPVADDLQQSAAFDFLLEHIVQDPGYKQQHDVYGRTRSLKKVSDALVSQLEEEGAIQ